MGSGGNSDFRKYLYKKTIQTKDLSGRDIDVLEEKEAVILADECGLDLKHVYIEALKLGVRPWRYVRNGSVISGEEQLRLLMSRVTVVGAGGLGGWVILMLARLGIGSLVVVDYDVFDETNLNRQALSSMEGMGKSKSDEAARVVASINPGIEVFPYKEKMDETNGLDMLAGSDVAVDALDTVSGRFALQRACRKAGIPLVHGAVAGFEGQLMTIYPGDDGFEQLYGSEGGDDTDKNRPEAVLGVPAPTPCFVGTLQAMEVIKILLRKGHEFRNVMVHVDLEAGLLSRFRLNKTL